MTEAFLRAAAWWDADSGPPRADLLPRGERASAGFRTRILAHVLGDIGHRSGVALAELPWVLGSTAAPHDPLSQGSELRRVLAPSRGLGLVHAGRATVAMTLIEGLALLVDHELALVVFAEDATPPYNEALASALLLSRTREPGDHLLVGAPRLHRSPIQGTPSRAHHPSLSAAVRIARAVHVGQPTVETVPSSSPDRSERWRIELCRAF